MPPETGTGRGGSFAGKEAPGMGRTDETRDIPSNDEEAAREGEKNRRELDEVPPPGTDPLHEGP
jgi:hypothetical protein